MLQFPIGFFKEVADSTGGRMFYAEQKYNGDWIGEFNPSTYTEINVGPNIEAYLDRPCDIGGCGSQLFLVGYDTVDNAEHIYELDPDNIVSDIGSADEGSTSVVNARGIGGMSSRLFMTSDGPDAIRELDPSDLSDIGSSSSPQSYAPQGIGGMNSRLYYCDDGTDTIYELDPDDLDTSLDSSAIHSESYFGVPLGCGGNHTQIFVASNADKYWEFDPDDFSDLSSGGFTEFKSADDCQGVGGLKE